MSADSREPSCVALIPARSGSERIPGKNARGLDGHPLLAYTISAALESKVFMAVIVSTDSEEYARIARHYGAEVPFLRPAELAGAHSPDIEFVEHSLRALEQQGRSYGCFSILRPTSPFRQPETIRRAWRQFLSEEGVDSLRAVEKCGQHPGKMWLIQEQRMTPLLPQPPDQPWHSSQYPTLPEVFVQNASLEIAWTRVVSQGRTIAGSRLTPFLTSGYEGLDLNSPQDWFYAEHLIRSGEARLPEISRPPYVGT